MLLECAIGDAYGCGFEYANENLPLNDLTRYVQHPRFGLKPGQYSDDTQMSIAVAELMLEDSEFETESVIRRFIDFFKRDPRDGYARHFQKVLENVSTVAEFQREVNGDSDKSGGAMRAGPCGYADTAYKVMRLARAQANVTHNSTAGRDAAAAAALLAHYFLYDYGAKSEVGLTLEHWVPGYAWDEPWTGPIGQKGVMDVQAAVTCIKATDNLADCLKMIVSFGGDVDTAGAIAMSAASCSRDMKKNLPAELYATLESGRYGRAYLEELDRRLAAKWPASQKVRQLGVRSL